MKINLGKLARGVVKIALPIVAPIVIKKVVRAPAVRDVLLQALASKPAR